MLGESFVNVDGDEAEEFLTSKKEVRHAQALKHNIRLSKPLHGRAHA